MRYIKSLDGGFFYYSQHKYSKHIWDGLNSVRLSLVVVTQRYINQQHFILH